MIDPATQTDAELRQLLLQLWHYRSGEDSVNTVYLGSMAQHSFRRMLGETGDWQNQAPIEDLVAKATREQLLAVVDRHLYTIGFMLKHPMKKCPCCGQLVPAVDA